ncbi:glycosyltransferase family 1 protein [Paenibacillus sp. 598K]|uniref:glycosyltransferase n=1 Tax=Paenibacillus sp. 598K TaxID=1117987 RepID=UPI000FFA527E|nr:glycosyltransferase [Paenibacillus sp. 598K]GBF76343.1 glycosyltransferase family 1 protein [Paenibacillus sp. 598K]
MMRKHIVLICEAMGGGVRKHVLDILLHLNLGRYRVSLIYSDGRADMLFTSQLGLLRDMGIGLYPVEELVRELSPRRDWAALRRTMRLLRELRPDIVHCHSSKAGGIGRLAAKLCGVRTILYTPHAYMFQNVGLSGGKRKLYTAVERLLSRITTLTINVSAGERQAAIEQGVLRPEQSVLIYNGISGPGRSEARVGASGSGPHRAVDAAAYASAWRQLLGEDETAAAKTSSGEASDSDEHNRVAGRASSGSDAHGRFTSETASDFGAVSRIPSGAPNGFSADSRLAGPGLDQRSEPVAETAALRAASSRSASNVISFAEAERAARLRSGGRLTIGTSARLDEQKDPWTFFRIAREIATRYDHVDFVYIGDGIYKDEISEQIRAEGLEDRIRLVGFRSNVMELIQAFDIYLITSLYEGLPYSIVEALSLGLPIVATDVIGNNEVVLARYNGLLFEAQHIREGVERLSRLIEHPELIDYYGRRSRQLYEEYFTLGTMMEALILVYEGGRPVGRPVTMPENERPALAEAVRGYAHGGATAVPAAVWPSMRE